MSTRAGTKGGSIGRPEVSITRSDGHSIFFPESQLGSRRQLIYVVLAVVLLVSAIVLHRFEYVASAELHTLLEAVSTVLALVIGALALVRFYSRKRSTYLLIGTGFLATSLLEGYHTVVTSSYLVTPSDPETASLIAWSWIAARAFLSLFLFVSWLAWYQERSQPVTGGLSGPVREGSVFATAALLTIAIFVFFARAPLTQAYFPGRILSRPGEIVPGFLFLLALAGFLSKREWRRDTFEHWLVMALMVSVAVHLGFLVFSSQSHDLPFLAAHVLKIVSYMAVLVGLLASVYVTFRRESEASAAILEANQALANEVKERSRAEKVLQESEERLQDFLDNANDLIHSTDPEGGIIYANEAWKQTFGYTDEELSGLNIHALVDPDSRDAFRSVVRRLFRGEAISDFEVVFRAKDGKQVICSGSSNCRFEAGHPVATRTILRNVTEERRAEAALARSEANIRALFESTGDAIWSVDARQRLITFNTAYALTAEVLSGKAPKVGDPMWKVTPAEDLEWYTECYERALSGTRFSAVREDRVAGQARAYELFFNPIESGDGIGGVVVFSKDITPRRIAEEALRKAKLEAEDASQAKSQFLANMSHELRTPLNSVIGFANVLLKNRAGHFDEKELGFLQRIVANGKHLLTLINEILDLSKIEAGRMELELETVELRALVHETLSQLEGQIGGKPVVLRTEMEGEPSPLLTDAGKLKQVIINLVGNALKFTERGEVVVHAETDESGAVERIRVRDTGPGIAKERLEAIFEAFQQADGSTTRRYGGTGLGLTISRSLCDLLGYRLSVTSELGEGSTFTIHVGPGVREEDEMGGLDDPPVGRWALAAGEPGLEFKGYRVLVVDDDPAARALLESLLEDLGCTVTTANDGLKGMDMARVDPPDLVTVDLIMPRMSGVEMLRAMGQDPQLRDIPAVVVSLVAEEESEELPVSVDLVRKPVDREDLIAVLRRNLSGDSGRVLVIEENVDTSARIQRYLRKAGLVAFTAEDGEAALKILRQFQVDLVIFDLLMPASEDFSAVREIRARQSGHVSPVVVLAAKNISLEDKTALGEWADAVIIKGPEMEGRLREVLDRHFAPAGELEPG